LLYFGGAFLREGCVGVCGGGVWGGGGGWGGEGVGGGVGVGRCKGGGEL